MCKLIAPILIMLSIHSIALASDSSEFEEAITAQYRSMENELRSMVAKQTIEMNRAIKERVEKKIVSQPTKEDETDFSDLLKFVAYNKAINHMRCAYDLITKRLENSDQLNEAFRLCNDKRQAELEKWNKLSDYVSAMDKKKLVSCELKARDFENERRFPPFEFLKTRDGPKALEFKTFNDCLIATF